MPVIEVRGLASGTTQLLKVDFEDLDENLLWWLRSKGVTIASSCSGEGVCKKCSIQSGWLTCMMTLRGLFELSPNGVIEVSYL